MDALDALIAKADNKTAVSGEEALDALVAKADSYPEPFNPLEFVGSSIGTEGTRASEETTGFTALDSLIAEADNEASAWEQFRYAFDKAGNITSYTADILEKYIPLGRVTFDMTDGFQYFSPEETYGEEFKEATPEQRRELIFQNKQKHLEEKYGEDFESGGAPAFFGELAKGVADPTTLLPLGQSLKTVAATSAALGTGWSILEDTATTGDIDPQKALVTGAAAGILAPATVAGARMLSNRGLTKRSRKTIEDAQEAINQKVAKGEDVVSLPQALKEVGIDPIKVADAQRHLETKIRIPANADKAKQAIRTAVTNDSATSRLYSKGLDKYLGTLSTRVRNISEPVFGRLRKFEFNTHRDTQFKGKQVEPFLVGFNKVKKGARENISRHLFNGDFDAAEGMMRSIDPRLADDFSKVKNILNTTGDELLEAGHAFTKLDNYFPRLVKDVNGLLESLGTRQKSGIEKAISEYAKVKRVSPSSLTPEEKSEIIDLTLRGYRVTTDAGKPRFVKPRQIERIAPEQMKFYASPSESLHRYLRGAVNDIEKRKFFGRSAQQTAGRFDPDASIGRYVADEIEAGNISPDKQDELSELLTARFVSGEVPAGTVTGAIRNLGYLGTIANPISALTQLGDVGISSAMKGLRNSMSSMFGTKEAKMIDIGLDQVISEEFRDAAVLAKTLDKALTYGGFKSVDRLGKETFINASLKKSRNMVKNPKGVERLRRDWGKVFGDEFDALVTDLQSGNISDNVKLLLFNELADIQPIALSEMPQAYLENPNGRILYMLKSFTLKQYDLARRGVIQQWKKGNKLEATKNATRLAGYMMAANLGTDVVKDFLQGREIPPETIPGNAMWALLGVYGLNEYTNQRYLSRGDIKGAAVNQIVPATPLIDSAFTLGDETISAITEGEVNEDRLQKTLRSVPLVGPLVYAWFGGGAERYNERLD